MSALLIDHVEAIFTWLLTASWQASVLAVFVLVIQRLLGARLNPRWRYALWLLVILRLVLPAVPESYLSVDNVVPRLAPAGIEPITGPLFVSAPLPSPDLSATIPTPSHPISIYSLLALGWLLGAVGLFVLTWIVNRRFALQVEKSPVISDPELVQLFERTKAELGIRRGIRLVENGQVQSPAIMGLFHPTLLLPVDVRSKFDAAELRLIFLHELAHLKRGDVFVQALIALLQILHWFNPVLWFAFRRMRIDREPATDALVLSRTGETEKERYGLMLIKLLEHFNQRHSLPTLVGILEDKDQFKRRFTLIARFTRGAYGWSLLGVAVITLLSVICLTKAKAVEAATQVAPAKLSARAALENKLKSIVIDKIDFDKADVGEVLSFLQKKSKELDPEHKGVNFVILVSNDDANSPAGKTVRRQISMKLENVPLAKVLLYIMNQTNLKYTVEDYAVCVRPAVDENVTFNVRTFAIPAGFFPGDVQGKTESGEPLIQQALEAKGISFPMGATATYIPASGKMVVRNTPEQLDKIMLLIENAGGVKSSSSSSTPPEGSTKPSTKLSFAMVEVDEKTYQAEAGAMDEAVRTGDLKFFADRHDDAAIFRTANLYLLVGQPGWYSEGQVQGYIESGKRGANDQLVLQAKSVFLGLNADFKWSKDGKTLRSNWSVAVPTAMDKVNLGIPLKPGETGVEPLLVPRMDVTAHTDEAWDMTPGKPHGLWIGQSHGWMHLANKVTGAGENLDDVIKSESPHRMAIFLTAEPKSDAQETVADPSQTSDSNVKTTPVQIQPASAPANQRVTFSGYLRSPNMEMIDWDKSVGHLSPVGKGENYEFYFKPDGSFELPNVKPGKYQPTITFVRKSSDPISPEKVQTQLAPMGIDGSTPVYRVSWDITPEFEQMIKGNIQIGLKVVEIDEDFYQANKAKVDAAVAKPDFNFLNQSKGVSLLSTPSVSTQPNMKASIDIVREFPYPTEFEKGAVVSKAKNTAGEDITLMVPPTPREFVTTDVGVSAEITPSIDDSNTDMRGKIILNGKFTLMEFEGFTESNYIKQGMPSFSKRESHFIEALGNKELKGIWIPGFRVDDTTVTDTSGKKSKTRTAMVKKRMVLFVSAERVQ